jgi:O-antigen/teichoic acid export membrane protein
MKIIDNISILKSRLLFNKSQRSRKVIVNAFNSLFVKAFSIFANFSLIAISIDCLNPENFGVWLTISSVITWISVFDLGLTVSLRNKITEAFAFNDFKIAKKYISTTYVVLLIIIVPIWIVFFIINPYIHWGSIFNTSIPNDTLKSVLLTIISCVCMQFLLKPLSSVLAGDQKHFLDSIITLIANIACIAVILLFKKYLKGSIFLLSVIFGVVPCIIWILASITLFATKYKHIKPSVKSVDFKYRKQLLGVGLKFFIIQLAGLIMYSSNNFIISHLMGNEEVTTYNIAFRYFSILTILYSLVNAPIWTAYAEAFALRDWKWIRKVTHQANLLCTLLLLLTLIMLLASPLVYKIWIKDAVTIPFSVNFLMAVNVGITLFGATYTSFINGSGKIRLQSLYSIFTSLAHIPLAYFLIKMLGLGLNGLLILTILWSMISLILWRIQYSKILGRSTLFIWN